MSTRKMRADNTRMCVVWWGVLARPRRAAGGRSGMIIHNAYGYGLFTGGLGVHYGAERLGCTVVPVSGGMTERHVQVINHLKPPILPGRAIGRTQGFNPVTYFHRMPSSPWEKKSRQTTSWPAIETLR